MGKDAKLKSLSRIILETSKEATDVAKRVCEDIRGDILRMSADLKIASSAADRKKVEAQIKARVQKMNAELNRVMENSLKLAQEHANVNSGEVVGFSPAYAKEILAMVQESQGENLASVYSRKMTQSIIERLRKATVSTIQEAALAGLTLREQKNLLREKWEAACKGLGEATFIDAGGRKWEARDYFTMNVRTNSMRVYNDVLAANITADGEDLAQISRRGDPFCKGCFPWEGRIISLTGKTPGFPTYEQARQAGCFHPNCTHVLQTVDDIVDAEEIELQKGQPPPGKSGDPMKDAFDLDVKRKQSQGMSLDEAQATVRRERLTAAVRNGIPSTAAGEIVAELTDGEVAALTDGAKVPKFSLAKKHEKARFTDGSAGGHVVLPRTKATAEALKELPGVKQRIEKAEPAQPKTPATLTGLSERQAEAEKALRKEMRSQFAANELTHSYEELEKIAAYATKEAYDRGSLGMYIPFANLEQVAEGGRFKNLHETGTGGGALDADLRRSVTGSVFGIPKDRLADIPGRDLEKFGLLMDADPKGDFKGTYGAEGYGKSPYRRDGGAACVRFKKQSVRATFTACDSLDAVMDARFADCLTASTFDGAKLTSFAGDLHGDLRYLKRLDKSGRNGFEGITPSALMKKLGIDGYIEAQYHGELSFASVESISFERQSEANLFAERFSKEIAKHGIKVYGPDTK